MRFRANKIIATGLMGLSLIAAANLYAADDKKADDKKVVATVNGTAITQDTLDSVLEMVRHNSPTGDASVDRKSILDDLIVTEVARQEANKSGIADRDDVKKKLKDFTDKLVLNAWMQEKASSFKITDADLKAAYDKQVAGADKYEYKARHILLKTKEDAEAAVKALDGGADFADLAKKKSTSPGKEMGGDLGWFKLGTMVPPFADAVKKLEVGKYTKEPVKTEFGWHVIKLEERRDMKLPPFESVKPQLQRQLEQEKMIDYTKTLRDKADVKVMLPDEKPADAKPAADGKASTTDSVKPADTKPVAATPAAAPAAPADKK